MEALAFPRLSTGFGRKVMDNEGNIWSRVSEEKETENHGNFIVCGKVIQTVITIRNGKKALTPVLVPNNVFSDENGVSYLRANERTEAEIKEKAEAAGCGYIIARKYPDGKYAAEAWKNGEQVSFPQTLWNEMGVAYKFVDYATYGEICKRTHGYYLAQKVEPVYLLDTQVGEAVQAVINGVKEHDTFMEEGEVKVQNMYHGETYKMKLPKLLKQYEYVETTSEGIQIWKPKDALQTWTFTNENIFGILWGGFEFLAKAMINLTDPDDVYGCNYEVFNGNDLAQGSHKKLKLFLPVEPLETDYFHTPGVIAGYGLCLEDVPKAEFVECPFPLEFLAYVS